jgi:O-antigen/teichoic acid export membrane protein
MAMAIVVFFLKDWIISILFSADFIPMRNFFLFQTIGDCLKVCAHTIAYVAVAKAMTRIYILSEIFQAIFFVCLSFLFLKIFGPVGVTYAYSMTFLLYFIIGLIAFRFYASDTASD